MAMKQVASALEEACVIMELDFASASLVSTEQDANIRLLFCKLLFDLILFSIRGVVALV